MHIREVRVEVCRSTEVSTYSFQCPTCRLRVCKPAAPHVVDTLVSAGVRPMIWDLPAELDEVKAGPPITHDDLLAFHFALADDGRLADSLAATGVRVPSARFGRKAA
jgi:hypothetical protein